MNDPPLRPQLIRPGLLSRLEGNCLLRVSSFRRTENEHVGLVLIYTQIKKAACRSHSSKAYLTPLSERKQAKIC